MRYRRHSSRPLLSLIVAAKIVALRGALNHSSSILVPPLRHGFRRR